LVWSTLVSYWGKTCCCAHHTFLLGFPTGRSITRHQSHGSTTADPKRSMSTLTNSSRCTITTPSTNLS
jgi:hypothetical protein